MPKKGEFPDFQVCMTMMRKQDPQIREDGFYLLLPQASNYMPELIEEFYREQDHGLKCWLLELIGEGKSGEAFPLLVECLKSSDENFRTWAIFGLKKLNTKAARQVLWEARSYIFPTSEETRRFQETLGTMQDAP